MTEFALIFGTGFVLNLLLTPVARGVALRVGLVDRPDGRRKLHDRVIPVAGGPAVLLSVAATVLAAATWADVVPAPHGLDARVLVGLFAAAMIICAVGMVDDCRGLRGWHKLLGQALAVGVVIGVGVRVEHVHLFAWDVDLGPFSIPLTMFLLLGAINSLNLLDGMDGLLGTVGMIICLAFGAMAVVTGQVAVAWVAFALAGALLAFLRYNFPPATIFMGDSGSMLVGLVVGVLAIHGSMKAPATIALAAPACVLIIPIFDTSAAIVRRKLAGRSVFSTDRAHLHHCLLRTGLSRRGALLVVSGLSLLAMAGGITSLAFRSEALAALAAVVVVALLITTRVFGYNEVRLVCRRLVYMSRSVFPAGGDRGAAHLTVRIQGTIDWGVLWEELVGNALAAGVRRIRLDIDDPAIGESFHARLDRGLGPVTEASRALKVVFPLAAHGRVIGRVEVSGDRTDTPLGPTVAVLTELVRHAEATAAGLMDPPAAPHQPAAEGRPNRELEPVVAG
ncbi:MAG: undecaprenyl/decaprenyl-phosphate alpha-N-acetylglucosaminyl 1-phosphate transferase [Gemmataceae bacterium]|nr:undecaprenyl/decaprenyl-phosphate alpha-N-acetylglucosaminyl 1-phosphate transferase [Gemmataceae bacterium]